MGKPSKVFNEMTIEVGKLEKAIQVAKVPRGRPVSDGFDLDGVHHYVAFANDKPKVFNLVLVEFAFFRAEVKVIGGKAGEHFMVYLTVFGFGVAVN